MIAWATECESASVKPTSNYHPLRVVFAFVFSGATILTIRTETWRRIMVPLILILAMLPRYAITHHQGGETIRQVIHRTGAKEVIGGDYFGRIRCSDKRFAFDLVMIKGRKVVCYKSRRPVLVISRLGRIRIEKPYRPRKDDYYAITGSFTPVDPARRCPRQVVVLKNPYKLKFVRFVGTYKLGQKRFKGHKYLWMDGGRASNPNAKVPTHIIRKW